MAGRRHEKPLRRVNPSGKVVWVARWTDGHGGRHYAGTFALKGACRTPVKGRWIRGKWDGCCAQHAIYAGYEMELPPAGEMTVGAYGEDEWLQRRPRSERTEECYTGRLKAVLDVRIEGRRLRDWPLHELRRSQAMKLLDVMLREQGRAARGAKGILAVLGAMYADAIEDELAEVNPFHSIRVRAADPRVTRAPRAPRVFSFEDMHRFAAACGPLEAMVRVLSDCGLRVGELFPLMRDDWTGEWLEVRRTAYKGRVLDGTKTDHGKADSGRRVPVPPGLEALLGALPPRLHTRLLFTSPRGEMYQYDNFKRDVWKPAQKATGLMIRPHDMRHSYVSLLRTAGVDPTDLASWSGHSEMTATQHYTHVTPGIEKRAQQARDAVG